MDILKLVTRTGSISREYFLPGRKFLHSATVTNAFLCRSSYHNGHSLTRRAPAVQGPPLSAPSSIIISRSLFPDRRQSFYSTAASPSTDKIEEGSTTVESTNEEEAAKNSEESAEAEGSSGDEASSNPPSMSQTGEPLPSEQDQSDWDSKIDKLYKQIELEVLAYEPSVLDSYQWFVITAASHLGVKVGKCWSPLKSNKLRFRLLKSAFVHKKHVVHYEIRTYHRFMILHKLTSSTADTFLEYIERNLPEGVGLKVTRVEAKALPHYLQKSQQQSVEA